MGVTYRMDLIDWPIIGESVGGRAQVQHMSNGSSKPDAAASAEAQSPLNIDVTRVLNAAERGEPQAAQRLLDVLYDELRELARSRMAREPGGGAGMTLQATALVHEAYLRVVGGGGGEDGG